MVNAASHGQHSKREQDGGDLARVGGSSTFPQDRAELAAYLVDCRQAPCPAVLALFRSGSRVRVSTYGRSG